MITAFERFSQIQDPEGGPSLRFANWVEEITRQVNLSTPILGTGSPEGVVEAEPTQLYMDTAGLAENVLYIKQSGTGDTGWILV